MTTAGYSGKPLILKLGIKPGTKIALINPPDGYIEFLGVLPTDVQLSPIANGHLDFIHLFTRSRLELESEFQGLKQAILPGGMLWISWPKKTSSLETDLDENTVRGTGLAHGLVDVKICAIDQDWSGLKFVYRKKNRA